MIIIDLFFKGNKEHRKASKQKSKWNFLIWFYLALLPAKLLLQPIWKRRIVQKRFRKNLRPSDSQFMQKLHCLQLLDLGRDEWIIIKEL